MRMQNSYDIAQTRKRAGEINVVRFPEVLCTTSPYVDSIVRLSIERTDKQ